MNTTNEEFFQHCSLLNSRYQVLVKIPSKTVFNNMISACTVLTILITPTILLNGISVITIMKCSQLKEKNPYFLIMVQSLADLVVGFVTLPLMSYVCITEVSGEADCFRQLVIVQVMTLPFFISLITLTVMTVDRYMCIVHPLKHRTLVTKTKLTVFLVSGSLFMTVCNALSVLQSQLLKGFLGTCISLFLLLAVFVYSKIFFTIKNQRRPDNVVDNTLSKSQNERKFVKTIKLVKSCFLAVACFLLCFFTAIVILLFEPNADTPDYSVLKLWAGTIMTLNSSLNSLIFFWARPLMRNEAYKVLKKMCTFGQQ